MSQENTELELSEIVKAATTEPGKIEMPIEDTVPKTTAITEEEMRERLANNAFKPTSSEDSEGSNDDIETMDPKEISKRAMEETLEKLDEDFADSYETRKKFSELGINPHLNAVNPEFEKNATEEEKEKARKAREAKERAMTQEEKEEELEEQHNEAMVVIEKMGEGYLKFTPEEKEKLEKAEVIRLNEIQKVDLSTIKTRKKKKFTPDKLISMTKEAYTFSVPLPSSGYIASLRGLSTQELQNLWVEQDEDVIRRELNKWRILYNCIKTTSIGKLTFDEFMKNTASTDFETLVFAALCATYPADDSIEITCVNQECGESYDFDYSLRSLIRAEKFDDDLKARIADIIEASSSTEDASRVHEESPVSSTESFILPESGYIVTTYMQSAQDLIDISYRQLAEVDDPAYNQAAILTAAVRNVLVPDPEDEGAYIEFEEPADIMKYIYNLRDKDLLILTKKIDEVVSNKNIEYGFMNVTCPHCGKYNKTLALNLTDILFHHSQRLGQTTVE